MKYRRIYTWKYCLSWGADFHQCGSEVLHSEFNRHWSDIEQQYDRRTLRGNTTVEFSKNHFFFYWLEKCFEPSKIWGKKSNHWKKICSMFFKSRIFSFVHVYTTFQNLERVFLEIWFFKTARTITLTISNLFIWKCNLNFEITFQSEARRGFSIS